MSNYLSGYWGVEAPTNCSKQGEFNEDSCGGPSIWALGPRPAKGADGLLWTLALLSETKYVYVFAPYKENDVDAMMNIFGTYLTQKSELAAINVYGDVFLLQTSHAIAIKEQDSDERGGDLNIIQVR
ncbi:MAG: hypothetical protein ACMG6E_00175 [Candidatus Roizmanbacteria bacterium]